VISHDYALRALSCDVGEECETARTLDCRGELTLVLRAGSRDPTRHDFTSFGGEALQGVPVLPVDVRFLDAELAHLSLEECLVPAASALKATTVSAVSAISSAEAAFPPEPAFPSKPARPVALGTVPLGPITVRTV